MEREKEGEFSDAIRGYRVAVDILITGVQGERTYEGTEEDGLVEKGESIQLSSCLLRDYFEIAAFFGYSQSRICPTHTIHFTDTSISA